MNNQSLTPYTLYIHHDGEWSPEEQESLAEYCVGLLQQLSPYADLQGVALRDDIPFSILEIRVIEACFSLNLSCTVYGQTAIAQNVLARIGSPVEYVCTTTPAHTAVQNADRVLLLVPDGLFDSASEGHPLYGFFAHSSGKPTYCVSVDAALETPFVMSADLHWFGAWQIPLNRGRVVGCPVPTTLTIKHTPDALYTYHLQYLDQQWEIPVPPSLFAILGTHPHWLDEHHPLYWYPQLQSFIWLNFLRDDAESGMGYVCRLLVNVAQGKPWLWFNVAPYTDIEVGFDVVQQGWQDYSTSSDFKACGEVQCLPSQTRKSVV